MCHVVLVNGCSLSYEEGVVRHQTSSHTNKIHCHQPCGMSIFLQAPLTSIGKSLGEFNNGQKSLRNCLCGLKFTVTSVWSELGQGQRCCRFLGSEDGGILVHEFSMINPIKVSQPITVMILLAKFLYLSFGVKRAHSSLNLS